MCFKNNSEGISTRVDEKKKGHILKGKKGGVGGRGEI